MERATVDRKNGTVEIDGKKYEIGEELQEQTPAKFFWSLLGGYKTKTDFENYAGSIFFIIDEKVIMEFEQNSGKLWVHYEKVWEKIKTKFGYDHEDVREMIKDEVEEHFNLKDVTPKRVGSFT